jgi:glycosyltransferase involved in cell wall biosynthesis
MKVSLITPSFNSSKFLRDTFDSVLAQTYGDIEYIVIDNCSTDDTLNIIKDYEDKFRAKNISYRWISEKDEGIYDGMNKGIKLATGDIVGIINSDDFFCDERVIADIVEHFEQTQVDSLYANIKYVSKKDKEKIVRIWNSKPFKPSNFTYAKLLPHPTFYVKKNVYEKYGYLNPKFLLGTDFEIMLRFLVKEKISTSFLDRYIIMMRGGGASRKNLKNTIINNNITYYRAFKENGIRYSILFPFCNYFNKIMQICK